VIDDDFDSRPGSATSLVRTVIGLYLRDLGGWISIAHLVALLGLLDVPAASTRMAVARLKKKGLLAPEETDGTTGYRIVGGTLDMLERGDRRIFTPRRMAEGDGWCLVSFSIAEAERDRRHQLRRRLSSIGCGTVSPALWIAPAYLSNEVKGILNELGLHASATLFSTPEVRTATEVAAWWDLDALALLHERFITEALHGTSSTPFARYIRGIDAWRSIPYLDPGLPLTLLPADWPGIESERLFARLISECADAAGEVVRELHS
jgi:phenylacetic acid degradation operon negative regulatory protein